MKNLKFMVFFVMIIMCGFNKDSLIARADDSNSDKVKIVTTNEIEYINSLLNASDSELVERGLTLQEIEEIRNYDYNADLLRLSEKNEETLSLMGYNPMQIEKIRAYNGQENAVEYVNTYDLSSAELQGNHWVTPVVDSNTVKIEYIFSWNHAPIFCITDTVALAWVGCDMQSYGLVMEVINESHTVYYCDELTEEVLFDDTPDVSVRLSDRIIEFDMKSPQDEAGYYAKTIEGQIIIRTAANSYNLERVLVAAAYGHTVLGLGPATITISTDGITPSIDLAWNQEELYAACYSFLAYDVEIALAP